MTGVERAVIGALGGLCAGLVKFMSGSDLSTWLNLLSGSEKGEIIIITMGYVLTVGLILMVVGGAVAWVSKEKERQKLFVMGVWAPALITTYLAASSGKVEDPKIGPNPPVATEAPVNGGVLIRRAYGQSTESEEKKAFGTLIREGIGLFFGEKRYWVVVGSFKNRIEADEFAETINQETDDLRAFVGISNSETGYLPVIVGYGTYSEALKIKEKALKLDSVKDAFLSPV